MNFEKKRIIYLDILRIVAVFAVILTHTSAYSLTNYEVGTGDYLFGNILDSISRLGVPLFIMISGVLMLNEDKNISFKVILNKYIFNILFLFIFWSLCYSVIFYAIIPIMNNQSFYITDVIIGFISGHYHMWYLNLIIGLYLITPFLRSFCSEKNKNIVLIFIVISLLSQFTKPLLEILSKNYETFSLITIIINKFNLNFFNGYVAYYLTGWYLNQIGINKKWKENVIYVLSVFSILFTIFYVQHTGDFENAYSNINLLIYIYSIGVFLLFSKIRNDSFIKYKKIIIKMSNLTFGVYIIHPLVIKFMMDFISYEHTRPLLFILFRFTSVGAISFGVCFIISKIPFLKKVVRG